VQQQQVAVVEEGQQLLAVEKELQEDRWQQQQAPWHQ
jgi:hypothetical protein